MWSGDEEKRREVFFQFFLIFFSFFLIFFCLSSRSFTHSLSDLVLTSKTNHRSVFPGELERIRVWFRDYKIPDGKPENKFGYNNKVQPKAFALDVIDETNGFWKDLTSGKRANDEGMAF